MKSHIAGAIFVLAFWALFLSAPAHADIAAGPAQANNLHAGAIVQFDVWIDRVGEGSISISPNSGSGEVLTLIFNQRCLHDGLPLPCIEETYQLTANVPGVVVWMDGSLGRGWQMHIETHVIQDGPSPDQVVKQEVKDQAREQSRRANNYADIFNSFAIGVTFKDPYTAAVLSFGALLESVYARHQDGIANDPDDPNSCSWDVSFPDYIYGYGVYGGIDPVADWNNAIVSNASLIDGWGEYVVTQANRKCKDQVTWGLINYGFALQAYSYYLVALSDTLDGMGDNPADLRAALRDASWDLYQYSQFLEGQ